MKVVCISIVSSNGGSYHLTVGKIYDVDYVKGCSGYDIVNDKGYDHYVESDLFVSLSDVRDGKLNELGI